MNIHKNARTTPNMRALIVGRRQAGETPRSIAGAVGVSAATVRKWLRRHESEGAAGLQDRTSRPHRLRTRITLNIKKLGRIEGVGHRITGNRIGQSAPRSRKEGGKGWEYLHLAVDDHSRLAYSEILPETRRSCLRFLLQALRFFRDHGVKVLRVMTGNGVSFRSTELTQRRCEC